MQWGWGGLSAGYGGGYASAHNVSYVISVDGRSNWVYPRGYGSATRGLPRHHTRIGYGIASVWTHSFCVWLGWWCLGVVCVQA